MRRDSFFPDMPDGGSPSPFTTEKSLLPRPFLKWAGGKSALLPILLQYRPQNFGTYFEPFLGGGALFFGLYRNRIINNAFLSDLNADLIETYITIRDDPYAVMDLLSCYPYEKAFYYRLRAQNPVTLSRVERAARLIYLNKTCYNGLYRVNAHGQFNVPFGRYRNPTYFDPENILSVSKSLQTVELRVMDFEAILEYVGPGDWVYFDPPYLPLSKTASFTAYQAGGFSIADQERLYKVCLQLSEKNAYFLLSNSDTPFIRQLYNLGDFHIIQVRAPRAIGQKVISRKSIQELLIANYPLDGCMLWCSEGRGV